MRTQALIGDLQGTTSSLHVSAVHAGARTQRVEQCAIEMSSPVLEIKSFTLKPDKVDRTVPVDQPCGHRADSHPRKNIYFNAGNPDLHKQTCTHACTESLCTLSVEGADSSLAGRRIIQGAVRGPIACVTDQKRVRMRKESRRDRKKTLIIDNNLNAPCLLLCLIARTQPHRAHAQTRRRTHRQGSRQTRGHRSLRASSRRIPGNRFRPVVSSAAQRLPPEIPG